jgi:integrase/recombinase XerD
MTRNTLSKIVAEVQPERTTRRSWQSEPFSLYAPSGARKYLNHAERQRALAAMEYLEPGQALFALTLAWTGARVSEVLALTPASFQIERAIVAIHTLKRRKHSVREVPVPPELVTALNRHFRLSSMQRDPRAADHRLWPWCRVTGWRLIKRVMHRSGITGCQACPRGFRHGFGVGTLQAGVPLNLLKRWLGHARISTTAIYADACGPEETIFAKKFWNLSGASRA